MTQRIVFLGSPQFAVPSLRALGDDPRFEIVLVVSQPDRPSGRGRKLTPPAVAAYAAEAGLPVFQPESLRDEVSLERLSASSPDLLVVVAYGEILRKNVLELAKGGALNVHPSLLPRYRGASPTAEAIRQGDITTGVSIMKLVRRLDAGPVVAQTLVDLDGSETTGALTEHLADVAAGMLPDVCDDWLAGRREATPQDDTAATYTREWAKADAKIDWTQPAAVIERLVRAALPWPVAWTLTSGQRLQIRATAVVSGPCDVPGHVELAGKQLLISTGAERLQLVLVQPEGKREMPALVWWNGLKTKPDMLGA